MIPIAWELYQPYAPKRMKLTGLHLLLVLCEKAGLLFRVGLDEPQLLAITVPFLDGHQLMTVDV